MMGGVYRGRLTYSRNTQTWLPVTLRPNFRGNKATLWGDERVSYRRVFFRVWLLRVYRGRCGGLT